MAGDVIQAIQEVGFDSSPYPSFADAFYLAFYPLVLLAHDLGVLLASLHRAQPGNLQELGGLQVLEEGNNA